MLHLTFSYINIILQGRYTQVYSILMPKLGLLWYKVYIVFPNVGISHEFKEKFYVQWVFLFRYIFIPLSHPPSPMADPDTGVRSFIWSHLSFPHFLCSSYAFTWLFDPYDTTVIITNNYTYIFLILYYH